MIPLFRQSGWAHFDRFDYLQILVDTFIESNTKINKIIVRNSLKSLRTRTVFVYARVAKKNLLIPSEIKILSIFLNKKIKVFIDIEFSMQTKYLILLTENFELRNSLMEKEGRLSEVYRKNRWYSLFG